MKQPESTSRREFLESVAKLACAPAFFPGLRLQEPAPERPRTLVLIELFGGLDGLGVLVPARDDDYRRLRPTLALPPRSLLRFDDERGFPAHLAFFHELWQEGHLRIVEGVGYPHSSMSHFAARVVWGAALPKHASRVNGWVARLRAQLWKDDPRPELLTHVGTVLAPALKTPGVPVLCFDRPEAMDWISAGGPGRAAEPELESRRPATSSEKREVLSGLEQTLATSRRLGPLVQEMTTSYGPSVEYPRTDLGRRLRTIAALIAGGLDCRVYSVQHGNFDMHSSDESRIVQAPAELDQALRAFLQDLEGTSAFENTLLLCHSEFGRRPKENSAGGCDHGAAGMTFLIGGGIRGGLSGKRPSLTELDANENLIPTMDFRRIYAAVIEQWFEADHVPVLLEELEVPVLL